MRPTSMTTSSGAEERTHQGVVDWYDPNRGYGFIKLVTGPDVFLHWRNLPEDQRAIRPRPGTRINFNTRTNHGTGKVEACDARMEI